MEMTLATRRLSRPKTSRPVAILLTVGLAAGCSDEGPATSQVDGPVVLPMVETSYTVGQAAGGHWDSFSRVTSVAFDEESRLFILDTDAHLVSLVDPEGELVTQFGSRGDGPGQFRVPQSLALRPGGEVVVADAGHRAFLIFDAQGVYQRQHPFPDGVMAGANLLFPHLDDGLVYAARGVIMQRVGGPGSGPPSIPDGTPIHRMILAGEAAQDTVLHRAWRPPRELGEPGRVQGPRGGVRLPGLAIRAFEPQLHLAVFPDGRLAVADSSDYRIQILDRWGGLDGTVERPIEPRPVTQADRTRERDRRLAELEAGGGPRIQIVTSGGSFDQGDLREMLEEQVQDMDFWPELPVIRSLAVDNQSRLWVHRSGEGRDPGPLDLLTAEGELLGTIPPDALTIPQAFGPDGQVAWIELDELEVSRVRVARLEGLP